MTCSLRTVGLALWLGTACVTERPERAPPEAVLTRTSDQVVWISGQAQQTTPQAVQVLPLRLRSPAGLLAGRVDPQAFAAAAQGFQLAMQTRLGPSSPLVSQPGPGVLVVAAELTDRLDEPNLLPHLDALSVGPDGRLDRVGLQVRFLEGTDGSTLAALASLREASRLGPLLVHGGTPEKFAECFTTLADRLRLALERSWQWNPTDG